MEENKYKRDDRGRFQKEKTIEECDQAMNHWIVSRTIGPNSRKAQLARKIFGQPKEAKNE